MISIYSLASAIVFYNLGMLLLYVLIRREGFITQYTVPALSLTAVLSIVRLLLPLDFHFSYVIGSAYAFPCLVNALEYKTASLPISAGMMLLGIWLGGTLWYIFKAARAEVCAYRVRRGYTCTGSEQVERALADFTGKYRVRLSPDVNEPYTAGIFRPEILLPDISYSDEELHFVLAHEIQHIKSRDYLKKLFFIAAEALFWWNPLSHVYVNEYEMLAELECDRRVTDGMDSDTLKAYLGRDTVRDETIKTGRRRQTHGGGVILCADVQREAAVRRAARQAQAQVEMQPDGGICLTAGVVFGFVSGYLAASLQSAAHGRRNGNYNKQ